VILRALPLFLSLLVGIPAASADSSATGRPTTRATTLPWGDQLRRIDVGGRSRSYLLHLPPGHDPAKPMPVVLIFHGAGMNAVMMMSLCGMNAKADQAGFVAVYPNGTGLGEVALTFNAWDGPDPLGRPPVDDVAFTAAILDDLGRSIAIDAKRVYATGLSNGGMMCYRLAAELSDRIAAIAPVAGTLAVARVQPTRPVPVIHFHGTADRIVPMAGVDRRARGALRFRSVDESVQTFVKLNGCPVEPRMVDLPDTADDGTTVKVQTWGPGKAGSQVVLVLIEGGGHTWPGRASPARFVGRSTRDISANDMIWDFFARHPIK